MESWFVDVNLKTLDLAMNLNIPAPHGDFAPLLSDLADNSCVPVWRVAVDSLLKYQDSNYYQWKAVKQQALDILEQRDVAMSHFESARDELRFESTDAHDGIFTKIKMLERFAYIYDAQPGNPAHGPEPRYILEPITGRKKTVTAYPHMQQPVSYVDAHLLNEKTHECIAQSIYAGIPRVHYHNAQCGTHVLCG